jgi:hypothetical protein
MKRTEKQEIKKDKAKSVKNSGRGIKKGDARFYEFLVDYKHNKKTFVLSHKNWLSLRKEAWKDNYKYPCVSVVMGTDSETKVAIIDWEVFKELIGDTAYGKKN